MEKIRIVKRKKRPPYFLGIFLLIFIVGAILWFLIDRNHLNFSRISLTEDSTKMSRAYNPEKENKIQSYLSFVSVEVIPADSINGELSEKGLIYLTYALDEIINNLGVSDQEIINRNYLNDSTINNGSNNGNTLHSLEKTGKVLVDIQKSDFPELTREGKEVELSINNLNENISDYNSNELKKFFVRSGILLQEMKNEKTDQLSLNMLNK